MYVLIKARNGELDGITEVKVFDTLDEAHDEMDAQVHKSLRNRNGEELLWLDWNIDETSAYIGFEYEWRIHRTK